MSTPAPSGGPSPLRVGGLVLLGVGVVAALIGLGTMFTGGGNGGNGTAAPSSGAATAPVTPSTVPSPSPGPGEGATPTSSAEVPVPSFGATPTNGIAAPPTTAPAAPDGSGDGSGPNSGGGSAGGPGGGTAAVRAPLRVYNNSTISGLAARAADDFRAAGWPVEQVANYPSGIIPTSTVYFRPGTGEQAGAEALGGEFGMRVMARFEGLNDASPGLIVIVTNDYRKRG